MKVYFARLKGNGKLIRGEDKKGWTTCANWFCGAAKSR